MDFNALISTISSYVPEAPNFLAQTIVSAFISAMFSNRFDNKVVIYQAKVDYINQIIDELKKDHEITATEYLKCKNLSDIAKLADGARARRDSRKNSDSTTVKDQASYNFDWFWRFFERAGYASDQDMKKLWASVLNGEIEHSGQFSYKAIETLFHMGSHEASVFGEMARYAFNTPFGECLLPSSEELYDNYDVTSPCVVDGHSDLYSILAAAYGITNEKIMYLDEYGLLSSMVTESTFTVTHDPLFITNDYYAIAIKLKDDCNLESLQFEVNGHRFTSVARQLFAVLEDRPSLSCFLDYGRLIQKKYSEFDVKVYEIISIEEDELVLEDSIDFLRDYKFISNTRLESIDDFAIV